MLLFASSGKTSLVTLLLTLLVQRPAAPFPLALRRSYERGSEFIGFTE